MKCSMRYERVRKEIGIVIYLLLYLNVVIHTPTTTAFTTVPTTIPTTVPTVHSSVKYTQYTQHTQHKHNTKLHSHPHTRKWMYPKSHTQRERCMLTICDKNYYNNYYNNHPSVTQLNAVEEHHTAKKTTSSNNQALVTPTTPTTPTPTTPANTPDTTTTPTLTSTSPLQPPKPPSDVTDLTETLSYLSNTSSFHLTALTNLTSTLPNNATASFSSLLQDFEREQSRQIRLATVKAVEVEKALTRAVGDLAYADTPLSDLQLIPTEFRDVASDKDSVRRSTNYTAVSRTERTGQIIKNWKAAPLYATASLLARWSTKCLTVPLRPAAYLTRIFQRGMLQPSSLSGSREAGKGEGYTGRGDDGADREAMRMQRRWKRSATTGALRRR